jgi:hypothetical protein
VREKPNAKRCRTLDTPPAHCKNHTVRVCGDPLRSTRLRLILVVAISILGVQLAPAAHAAGGTGEIDVFDCPTTIPSRTIGVLQNDVVCSAGTAEFPKYGIVLGKDAQLALNGFTISYQPSALTDGPVLCVKACTVFDGTIISSGGGSGVHVNGRGRLTAYALVVTGFDFGLFAAQSTVNASHVSIDATVGGLWYTGQTTLDHVDVTVHGPLGDSFACISAASRSGRVLGHDVNVTGCRTGVWGTRGVNLSNLTVTNSFSGVFSEHKITLANSSVTGSVIADIYSGSRPKLTNTTCGTSLHFRGKTASGNWGVRAND